MNFVLNLLIAFIGAIVGSFLNVCIYRIPLGKSLVAPASSCPACGHPVKPYDNIPILSFLLLRGRCRHCGARISPRYPAVELITAALALLLFRQYGLSLPLFAAFLLTAALIVVSFIDLEHKMIPNVITLPGIPLFAVLGIAIMGVSFFDALLGMILGGGILYLIAVVYELLTKREGMGGGDIKLLAMLGAFFGWQSLLFILLFSSLLGSFVGIAVMVIRKEDTKYAVPFGPFLSAAAVAYLFWGGDFARLLNVCPV